MLKKQECGTCIDNDCGLCDRKGIWVEDEDTCEKWRDETWKDRMMRHFEDGE